MGLPPHDMDLEEELEQEKKRATIKIVLAILLVILVVFAVFYGISLIFPSVETIGRWLGNFYQMKIH